MGLRGREGVGAQVTAAIGVGATTGVANGVSAKDVWVVGGDGVDKHVGTGSCCGMAAFAISNGLLSASSYNNNTC